MSKSKKYLKETAKYLLRCPLVIRHYISEVERLYAMSAEEMLEYKEKRFLEIFRKAYTKSSFYHEFYSQHGVTLDMIKTLDDIKKLPILTKEMVKTHGIELLTEPKWKLVFNHSSGTTGTPLTVWESWPALWREQAYLYCSRKRCGFIYGQPLVSLRGNLQKADTHMKVHASNTLYLSSYNLNEKNAQLYYDLITAHNPVAIEGYPSSLYRLVLMLRDKGLRVHIPVTFTSSENLLDNQRQLIEHFFDTQIFDHFGSTERTIMLNETINHNGYYEAPGYSINEFVENGEITTSLINDAFPLIRYRGHDVMTLATETDGLQVIVKNLEGNQKSVLVDKNGNTHRSVLLTGVLKEMSNIEIAQFVQKEKGVVELNVVGNAALDDQELEKLRRVAQEHLGEDNFYLTVSRIDQEHILLDQHARVNIIANLLNVNKGGIKRIDGRSEDFVVCKDGTRMMRLDFIGKGVDNVAAFQVVQEKPGELIVLILPSKAFVKKDFDLLRKKLYDRVGENNMDCHFEMVSDTKAFRYTRSGKFKLIMNMSDNA